MDVELRQPRDRAEHDSPERQAADVPRPEHAPSRDRFVVCAACDGLVTRASERIDVTGARDREFMNPAGTRFTLLCYACAPGTLPFGNSSLVWTWFPGYAWQAVACRGCIAHLGWSFTRPDERFFALIAERVREVEGLTA